MQFNWNVSIGDVVTLGGVLLALFKMYAKFSLMEFKVEQMWDWYNKRYPDFPPHGAGNGKSRG